MMNSHSEKKTKLNLVNRISNRDHRDFGLAMLCCALKLCQMIRITLVLLFDLF